MRPSFRILHNRDFLYLFVAGAVSTNGSAVSGVALTWLIYAKTESAMAISLVGLATVAPTIVLGLLAGTAVDRFNRKRIMILSDLVRAIAVLTVPIFLVISGFSLTWVLFVIVVVTVFSTLFRPAQNASLPQLVEGEAVQDANGMISSASTVMRTVGNAIGGVLFGVSVAICFIYDSLTYLFSASMIASLKLRTQDHLQKSSSERSLHRELGEGIKYIGQRPALLTSTLGAALVNFFSTLATTFIVIYVSTQLNGSSTVYGVFLALMSVGAACGTLLVGRLRAVRYAGKAMASSFLICSVALLVLALGHSIPLAYLMAPLLGACLSWANTVLYSALQLTVPNEVLGRVFSVDEVGSYASVPAGQIVGGLLIQGAGIAVDFAVAGVGLFISTMLLLGVRDFRRFAYRATQPTGS